MDRIQVNGLTFDYRPGTTDEKVIQEVIKRHNYSRAGYVEIAPTDYWLDLGGNIGTFSVLAASQGCQVMTFEPEPENYGIMCGNFMLNGVSDHVDALRMAVTAQGGSADLFLSKGANKYRHTIFPKRGRVSIPVIANRFHTVLMNSPITAVKMDIEGAEIEILDSMEPSDWGNVRKLVFEYHFDFDRSIPRFLARIEKLSKHFKNIYHAKMPENKDTYDFFPSGKTVYCSL